MYRNGVLPTGELLSGIVQGDIALSGGQVICGACHRRSGLGSKEGQEVVPAVTGDILYEALRLPTSKPPLAPMQRPAYTDETLKRAIQAGIGADGKPLSPLMPRYALPEQDLDSLIAYLKTLNADPDPGVGEHEIHFATVLADSVDPAARKAFLDVFDTFIAQKNAETRHETHRAEHAPWHKQWVFGPYRKWVLHVWELKGPPNSWRQQLEAQYAQQPVFAVLSGLAPGDWKPVHAFCEANELPCLFPVTDLPVVEESDFYTVYFSRGMRLEADTIARHLSDDGLLSEPVVQVYRADDGRARTAADELRQQLSQRGALVTDMAVVGTKALGEEFWRAISRQKAGGTLVLWLGRSDADTAWAHTAADGVGRLYLSTTLYGVEPGKIPKALREQVYFVHPQELPAKLPRLLARSTGWFKAKRIYDSDAQEAQAAAYFALKMAGGALAQMRGFFVREYMLERVEHMVDLAAYTSVYPRVRLAPGQRFVSRAAYIAKPAPDGRGLVAVTEWRVP